MNTVKFWAVVPAAGNGSRLGSIIPKQYLTLNNKLVIEHTLSVLLQFLSLERIVVVLAENDSIWHTTAYANHPKILTAIGGDSRQSSVLKGLENLKKLAADNDWVMVHDAARPCLAFTDIQKLVRQLEHHPVGGLLGLPVCDTIKYTNASDEINKTIDRSHLWQAFTPQMFRYEKLLIALQNAYRDQLTVTDEASAIEMLGEKPLMVKGRRDNIKITEQDDLAFASLYLNHKE